MSSRVDGTQKKNTPSVDVEKCPSVNPTVEVQSSIQPIVLSITSVLYNVCPGPTHTRQAVIFSAIIAKTKGQNQKTIQMMMSNTSADNKDSPNRRTTMSHEENNKTRKQTRYHQQQ